MTPFRLLTLCAVLCCFACSEGPDSDSALDTLHGRWTCDGTASVALLPSSTRMDPLDRLLTARLYDHMNIGIDAKERVLTLNIGNRRGAQPFSLIHDDGAAVHLMADELLSIEPQDDGSIVVYDPMDSAKKMVFRRM